MLHKGSNPLAPAGRLQPPRYTEFHLSQLVIVSPPSKKTWSSSVMPAPSSPQSTVSPPAKSKTLIQSLPAPEVMVSSLSAPTLATMVLAAALPLIVSSVMLPTYTPSMALFDQFTVPVRVPLLTSGESSLEVRLTVRLVVLGDYVYASSKSNGRQVAF